MVDDPDLTRRLAGAAALLERTVPARRGRERRCAESARGHADRDDVPARAGDGAGVHIDREVLLAEHAVLDFALGHRREHVHLALGELGADRSVAIGGVAQDPLGPLFRGLAINQVLGLWPVCLPARRDVHRDDQRLAAARGLLRRGISAAKSSADGGPVRRATASRTPLPDRRVLLAIGGLEGTQAPHGLGRLARRNDPSCVKCVASTSARAASRLTPSAVLAPLHSRVVCIAGELSSRETDRTTRHSQTLHRSRSRCGHRKDLLTALTLDRTWF